MIPTVHYIGDKIFELVHAHPKSQVLFLITACEMTLEMFGDLGEYGETSRGLASALMDGSATRCELLSFQRRG